MESKKQLILMILNELSAFTDEKHPLTQAQIARNLSGEKYTCDRKTVCRNIKFLKDMGYPIKKLEKNKGFYMDRKVFSVDDVKFIEMAILDAEGKSLPEKLELAKKVTDILNKTYRRN
ncbi:MAG: hypothetical protein IKB51_01375 [Clostridia bacterium]|nr:hypothetical protein [Clostridia bacterium]